MTAKNYLAQLRKIAANIAVLQEEIIRCRTRLESTTMNIAGDRVQSSGSKDRFADQVAALADKETVYCDMLEVYETLRQRIVAKVLGLDNPVYSRILYARYVQGKTLAAIADELGYSYDRTRHIHGEALQAFTEKYLRATQVSTQ